MQRAFEIGGMVIEPGTRGMVDLPVSKLSNHTQVTLPIHVLHGPEAGPALFVSAAVHGDELNGVEIVRRILKMIKPGNIRGTLICVPVVNVFGFIGQSRYLPDRRDLNRSFPGSAAGSLAARLAHLFLTEVVRKCQYGIDLHTAAVHRTNLPQIRSAFEARPEARRLAEAFGCQVVLDSPERPGSLRKSAREAGVEVLVYEGGEGLRYDEYAISAGVEGIARVMLHTGMLEMPAGVTPPRPDEVRRPMFANASKWVRAPEGGFFRTSRRNGEAVTEGELVGAIANPYDETETPVRSPRRGIIIGRATLPVVNMGDALFHIAWSDELATREIAPDAPAQAAEPVMDEDEII